MAGIAYPGLGYWREGIYNSRRVFCFHKMAANRQRSTPSSAILGMLPQEVGTLTPCLLLEQVRQGKQGGRKLGGERNRGLGDAKRVLGQCPWHASFLSRPFPFFSLDYSWHEPEETHCRAGC